MLKSIVPGLHSVFESVHSRTDERGYRFGTRSQALSPATRRTSPRSQLSKMSKVMLTARRPSYQVRAPRVQRAAVVIPRAESAQVRFCI